MPKKIGPQLRARCVRLVRDHQQQYPSLTAAVTAVARQEGVSRESVRRWLAQADVDDGTRPGVTSEESAEVKRLKMENKRLREDNLEVSGPDRGPHRHRCLGRRQDPCPGLDVQRGHRADPDDARGSVRKAEVGRPAPPPARPCRHVPRRGGPGDAEPRPRRRATGEEATHHHPRSRWKTCR